MNNSFRWEKSFFSRTYKIFSNDQLIGKLRRRPVSQSADGEINGKSYIFETEGFFKQKTKIIDTKNNTKLGEITYNNWMTKAEVSIQNEKVNWSYDNFWNTRWSIYNSDNIEIKYTGSPSKGQIDSNTHDDLLLLSGLFTRHHYWQMAALALIFLCLVAIT